MREKLPFISTVIGATVSLLSSWNMHDHVRFVDIVTLFFGGIGTGAGIMGLMTARKLAQQRGALLASSASAKPLSPSQEQSL